MTKSAVPMPQDDEGRRRWHLDRGVPWGEHFDGPAPITMAMMQMPGVHSGIMSLSVHLANEHRATPHQDHGAEIEHMLAHLYGQFRPGQEHYHARSGVDMMNPVPEDLPVRYHHQADAAGPGSGSYRSLYKGTDFAAALAAVRESLAAGHEYVMLESLRERIPGGA